MIIHLILVVNQGTMSVVGIRTVQYGEMSSWAGFGGNFVRPIWLFPTLNLNGRCFINLTTFYQTLPLFLGKCVQFCQKITERLRTHNSIPMGYCTVHYKQTTGVAANLYIREYVPMGIDSLQLGIDSLQFCSESIPMGTFLHTCKNVPRCKFATIS